LKSCARNIPKTPPCGKDGESQRSATPKRSPILICAKKEFPNEPAYRHTMKEAVDSLQMLVHVLTEQKGFAKKEKEIDPALVQLIQIDEGGFLEPFALLNRADKEIAQDYAPYRDAHRDTLYRYFDEFVVAKAPQ